MTHPEVFLDCEGNNIIIEGNEIIYLSPSGLNAFNFSCKFLEISKVYGAFDFGASKSTNTIEGPYVQALVYNLQKINRLDYNEIIFNGVMDLPKITFIEYTRNLGEISILFDNADLVRRIKKLTEIFEASIEFKTYPNNEVGFQVNFPDGLMNTDQIVKHSSDLIWNLEREVKNYFK